MTKVSVIIPVYNAEQYLKRCLDSICNQTLKDIEIICVNDASTDKSLERLNEYVAKDNRFKVINLETNRGESAARNKGLEIATGEYLAFVDNDDEIDLDFYEKLYEKAKETNADVIKGEVHVIDYDGKEQYGNSNVKISNKNSKFYFTHNWWTAIYKKTIIIDNNIDFPEGMPLGGDILFLNKVLTLSKKIELVDDVFYHYYRREDSGDSKILSDEKIDSASKIYNMIIDNLNKSNIYKENIDAYCYLLHWLIDCSIGNFFRGNTQNGRFTCIRSILDIYNLSKNKDILDSNIIKYKPYLSNFLKNNDEAGLYYFFKENNTLQKLLLAGMRAKVLSSMESENG